VQPVMEATPAVQQHQITNPQPVEGSATQYANGNSLAVNVRSRQIAEAIALAGDTPTVNRDGGTNLTCVSWHAKGMCFDDCDRDHAVHTKAEAMGFVGRCQLALA
jgi:hypothetical protein